MSVRQRSRRRPVKRSVLAALMTAALTATTAGALAPPAAAAPADAPGAPGASATWTTGDKEGLGTSITNDSKVWYTLTGGTMSEVYYPNGNTPNVRELQFAVSDGTSFTQRETDPTVQRAVSLVDRTSLTYQQVSSDSAGRWRLTKTYVTDPARSSVVIKVQFENLSGGDYKLYALYDPSLAGDSGNDSGQSSATALVSSDTHAADGPVASALVSSAGFAATSTGYVGSASDPWQDLVADNKLDTTYPGAGPGNIAQIGQIPTKGRSTKVTLALGFGTTADEAGKVASASAKASFARTLRSYQSGWKNYLCGLKPVPASLSDQLQQQYLVSLMTVKAHEDKTNPGAFIASLTFPWGQAVDASGAGGGGNGYHFVWARDEYQQVSALLAAGDTAAAKRAVNWLFTRQQLPDGHFPQTSKVDGTPDQTNVQLDETAFPIILAWQTRQFDRSFYRQHIAPAADYLVANGPSTPQERWEETGGYSPSTIADMIAGLTAAAAIAAKAGDAAGAAIYQATADSWQRQIQGWTYTTTGNLSDGQYYVRITSNGTPDDGTTRNWANGAGVHKESDIVDGGFLELTRLGVKAPNDPAVAHSLAAVDQSLRYVTPQGDETWRRYTFDGYGEKADGAPWDGTGIGRPWPLLSGERGEYVLANGGNAVPYLQTMADTANAGYMIPEQIWDQDDPTAFGHVAGEGTGSAAPLAWAMAQYVRLAQGIANGSPVETPSVVADRYARGSAPGQPALTVTSPTDLSTATARTVQITGSTAGKTVYVSVNGTKQKVRVKRDGTFTATVDLPATSNQLVIAAVGADGGTNQVVRTVLAYGQRIGGLTDPTADDNGPGSYVYPTDGAFNPGAFDLTNFDVYRDGDNLRLVTRLAGQINNPWGGNGMSVQRLNIYLHDPADTATASTPALPGTNMDTAGAWTRAIVADGRYPSGVYGPDQAKVGDINLQVVKANNQIVVTIPATALGTLDPATAGYQVSMFGDAENGEGIGNIRPVYAYDYWNTGDPWWVKQYRFGGGAGVIDDALASKDSDTSDPNAIDIISGTAAQSDVLNWKAGSPVVVPYVTLNR